MVGSVAAQDLLHIWFKKSCLRNNNFEKKVSDGELKRGVSKGISDKWKRQALQNLPCHA